MGNVQPVPCILWICRKKRTMKKLILIALTFPIVGCSYHPTDIRTNHYSSSPAFESSPYVRIVPRYSQTRVDCDYIISPRNPGDYPPYRKCTPPVYFSY